MATLQKTCWLQLSALIFAMGLAAAGHSDSVERSEGRQGVPVGDAAPRDFGKQFVGDHPFMVTGLTDSTSMSDADVDIYLHRWHASGGEVISRGSEVCDRWESRAIPWVKWVSPGVEGSDGKLSGTELGVDVDLPPGLPHRYGYHIGGEPKTRSEINEVIRTAAALKEYDPGGLVYVGLNTDPSDEMVAQMFSDPHLDAVIGHKYVSDNSYYADLNRYRTFGLRYNKPYFRFVRAFKQRPIDTEVYSLTDSDFRFKTMSALTYGYSGIFWFVYNLREDHAIDPRLFTKAETYRWLDRQSPAFASVATLNKELFHIGEQIKRLTSTDVRLHLGDHSPYFQPRGTSDWTAGAGGDPYITSIDQLTNDDMDILIGFFQQDGTRGRYFMVQNTLHTHNENPQKTTLAGIVRVAFDFSSVGDKSRFEKHSIQKMSRRTGRWESMPLASDGADRYHLDLSLNGGSAELLRYSFPGIDDERRQSGRSHFRWRSQVAFGRTADMCCVIR